MDFLGISVIVSFCSLLLMILVLLLIFLFGNEKVSNTAFKIFAGTILFATVLFGIISVLLFFYTSRDGWTEMFVIAFFFMFIASLISLHFTLLTLAVSRLSGGFCLKLKICMAVPILLTVLVLSPHSLWFAGMGGGFYFFVSLPASFIITSIVMIHHAYKKSEYMEKWIALVFLLPVVGSLIYISVYVLRGNSQV
jgi:hypothetical protein